LRSRGVLHDLDGIVPGQLIASEGLAIAPQMLPLHALVEVGDTQGLQEGEEVELLVGLLASKFVSLELGVIFYG